MAKEAKETDPDKMSRRKQFVETYRMARKSDRAIGWWILGAFLVGAAIGFALFCLLPGDGVFGIVIAVIGAFLLGLLARHDRVRSPRAEGGVQPDGGPARRGRRALRMLRRGWKSDVAIAFTKQQDIVHRVVGPPGIVLVGEGNPHRLRQLMASERRKHERVAAEVPIHEVVCGNDEGQVPLPKLVAPHPEAGPSGQARRDDRHPQPAQGAGRQRSPIPMPKGPVPTSMKGMRGNMRGR